MNELLARIQSAEMYDLAQPLSAGVPHFPTHPPFGLNLTKHHGDFVSKNGGSSASELLTLSGHSGTHIDALCHFSCGGRLHGGVEPEQSASGGIRPLSADTIGPIFRRAVLVDVAGREGVDALAEDFVIAPEHLAGAEIMPGDVVLLRTGWGKFWNDQRRYTTAGKGGAVMGPGPEEAAARWLSERRIFAAGSDTLAFEHVPSPDMPVHVHLLVESGIHIIENLCLEELARDGVKEFLFAAAPLKIPGATGSPIRPVALVL